MFDTREVKDCLTNNHGFVYKGLNSLHNYYSLHKQQFTYVIHSNFGQHQGAGKRPRQCSPNGPKSNKTATRGPKGPESGLNKRVRGPEGPEDEQSSVFVSALASATICFSRFSKKSRFSWHNSSTLMTAKMHENFSRVSYSQHEHHVKKSKQFVDRVKSYAKLKFRKNAAFVSKSRPSLSIEDKILPKVTHV